MKLFEKVINWGLINFNIQLIIINYLSFINHSICSVQVVKCFDDWMKGETPLLSNNQFLVETICWICWKTYSSCFHFDEFRKGENIVFYWASGNMVGIDWWWRRTSMLTREGNCTQEQEQEYSLGPGRRRISWSALGHGVNGIESSKSSKNL